MQFLSSLLVWRDGPEIRAAQCSFDGTKGAVSQLTLRHGTHSSRVPLSSTSKAGICVIGAMTGSHPGVPMSQGEELVLRMRRDGYPVTSASGFASRYARLPDIFRTIATARRHCGVLLVQLYGGPSFLVEDLASRLGRRLGYRVLFHAHGGALPEFLGRHPRWARRVLSRAEAAIAPSTFLSEPLLRHGARAVHVIPNVVEVQRYPHRIRHDIAPRLLWMRTFHPIYNPVMAIRVLALVLTIRPDARLVMAGPDKGLLAAVKEEAARLSVTHAVSFPGFLDHAGKVREGGAADVFLGTNRIDNMPVSLVEAAAMGIPIVATAVGGVPHMLRHHDNGLLVGDDDAHAMASEVLRLLEQPDLVRQLSARGRELAESCDWAAVRPLWDEVLYPEPASRAAEL